MVKKEDHREIAKDLDWYFFDNRVGQGLPILLPDLVFIRNKIQEILRIKQQKYNFQEVITPILGTEQLYKISGHLEHYEKYMFAPLSKDHETFRLKPMTCPHHCMIFKHFLRSYREIPLRVCENSILHRYEASGSLKGLERVRTLELADHHIFLSKDKINEELDLNFEFISEFLKLFSFRVDRLSCSLHDEKQPEKFHNDQQLWEDTENLVIGFLQRKKIDYSIQIGEAAFYGPKLDFEMEVANGKYVTIATIQLDFLLPNNFGLKFINKKGESEVPLLIHHSPIGSYQRFISLLLEQKKGKLPFFLLLTQVVIIPLIDHESVIEYSQQLKQEMLEKGIRSVIWTGKSVSYLIRKVYEKKIPYYFVVGKEEVILKSLRLKSTYEPEKDLNSYSGIIIEELEKQNKIF